MAEEIRVNGKAGKFEQYTQEKNMNFFNTNELHD